jgi:hypothetical protein
MFWRRICKTNGFSAVYRVWKMPEYCEETDSMAVVATVMAARPLPRAPSVFSAVERGNERRPAR